jgi:hypothetical protein
VIDASQQLVGGAHLQGATRCRYPATEKSFRHAITFLPVRSETQNFGRRGALFADVSPSASKKSGLVTILETGGFVMTELRRTNELVGVLRAGREFSVLRSREFVSIAELRGDRVRAFDPGITKAPPL